MAGRAHQRALVESYCARCNNITEAPGLPALDQRDLAFVVTRVLAEKALFRNDLASSVAADSRLLSACAFLVAKAKLNRSLSQPTSALTSKHYSSMAENETRNASLTAKDEAHDEPVMPGDEAHDASLKAESGDQTHDPSSVAEDSGNEPPEFSVITENEDENHGFTVMTEGEDDYQDGYEEGYGDGYGDEYAEWYEDENQGGFEGENQGGYEDENQEGYEGEYEEGNGEEYAEGNGEEYAEGNGEDHAKGDNEDYAEGNDEDYGEGNDEEYDEEYGESDDEYYEEGDEEGDQEGDQEGGQEGDQGVYEYETPTVDMFLEQMSELLVNKSADGIADFFAIEPPFNDIYRTMVEELREHLPWDDDNDLFDKVDFFEPFREWPAFGELLVEYLCYIRDIDLDHLLDAYFNLEDLAKAINATFAHPSDGLMMLPTVLKTSRVLGMLSTRLSRSGEDLQQLREVSNAEGGEEKRRESLPERTSNVIKAALTTCLGDRGAPAGSIKGKKSIIYLLTNLSLKVLFRGRDSGPADEIFSKISAQSPPLALYPKAQRVTYLYYLGLYHYTNSHYLISIRCLEAAYFQCHSQALKQRRLILLPLVASSVVMGRFPSQALLSRPEAAGLAEAYLPVCRAIVKGDLVTFRRLMDPRSAVAQALKTFKAYYEVCHKCQVLVWRCLARKLFILTGSQPANEKSAPTFSIQAFCALLQRLERQSLLELEPTHQVDANGEPVLFAYVHPEFEGTEYALDAKASIPDLWEAKCICASLIDLGLLNAYMSHKQLRCAIQGAKRISPIDAGFPNVFQALCTNIADDGEENEQEDETDEVPGWKLDAGPAAPGAGTGPGMVINLSGVKAIGEG